MDDEWGPWIVHDGLGCPVPRGAVVRGIWDDGSEFGPITVTGNLSETSGWLHCNIDRVKVVIRYRTQRAITQLRAMIADLPQPSDPVKHDA